MKQQYIFFILFLFLQLPVTTSAVQTRPANSDTLVSSIKPSNNLDTLAIEYFKRRQELIDATVQSFDTSSPFLTFKFDADPKQLDLQIPDSVRFADEVRHRDYIGERLLTEQADVGPVIDFFDAIRSVNEYARKKKKKKRPDIRKLPLPTPLEMDVLSRLWRRGPSMSTDLFAQLDSTLLANTTAEMFWRALNRMAKRGFVSEKIVSPQLTMTFAIGPVLVPVEMSSKNLKNRVYEYGTLVDEAEMFSYLAARNYLARNSDTESTNSNAEQTNALLYQMILNRRNASF